jgi:excisionase family DNA binding protein
VAQCVRTERALSKKANSLAPKNLPPAREELPDLLTAAEVAEIFRRSDRTIREWIRKGWLRQVKIGRSVFYLAEDVRRLVASGLSDALRAHTGKRPKRTSRA